MPRACRHDSRPGPPWQPALELSPVTGRQADGEYLEIRVDKLPALTSTATVTLHVTGG